LANMMRMKASQESKTTPQASAGRPLDAMRYAHKSIAKRPADTMSDSHMGVAELNRFPERDIRISIEASAPVGAARIQNK
jgi:hypothetical protein